MSTLFCLSLGKVKYGQSSQHRRTILLSFYEYLDFEMLFCDFAHDNTSPFARKTKRGWKAAGKL
jgi:hypothetical protein